MLCDQRRWLPRANYIAAATCEREIPQFGGSSPGDPATPRSFIVDSTERSRTGRRRAELQWGGNDMALLATKTNHKEETRVWALIILWGVVTLMAGYALWMKVAGF